MKEAKKQIQVASGVIQMGKRDLEALRRLAVVAEIKEPKETRNSPSANKWSLF
ncbi:MAG: hypothetical protein ABIH99_03485 [Candidatus Micrarchaeota archaeon]